MEQKLQMQTIKARFELAYENFLLQVDLHMPNQGVTAIFGHSGSGKTTLLRCIAGLEQAQGLLCVGEQVWQDEKHFMPTYQRPIGYVFQESSLFEHLDVIENIRFGMDRALNPINEAKLQELIQLLDLDSLLQANTDNLSGGEKQRVAIARAMAVNPQILLLDEPLASLDAARRNEILKYLEKLKSKVQIPIIYVSHSRSEVSRLADYLVVMEKGKATFQGSIQASLAEQHSLFNQGENPFSVLFGKVLIAQTDQGLSEIQVANWVLRMPAHQFESDQSIRLHIDAKDVSISLSRSTDSSILNIVECHIDAIEESEDLNHCIIRVRQQDLQLLAKVTRFSCTQLNLQPGMRVYAQIKAVSIVQ